MSDAKKVKFVEFSKSGSGFSLSLKPLFSVKKYNLKNCSIILRLLRYNDITNPFLTFTSEL